MKIFNWVHKTFHHSVLKEGFAQNGTKKTETAAINEVDRHALLKQVDLDVEALHDWRDGILTIGTFGFESLKPSNEPKEYLVLESEEDEDENDDDDDDGDGDEEGEKSFVHEEDDNDIIDYFQDEELNPLMFTAFGHKSKNVSAEKGGNLIIGAYELNIESKYSAIMEMESEEKKKKGERRITLADLFLADAGDVGMALEQHEKVLQKKTADVRSKSSLSFAKKLIPRVKEDSHPIKNFQRLMRRMLKRKIHPEIEDKINKSAEHTHQIGLATTNGGIETFESLSLLPTQDAIA